MSNFEFQPLWGEPPASRGGGKNKQIDLAIEAFVALLRTVPGRWAEMSSPDNNGHPASRASIIAKRYPDVEVMTRRVDSGDSKRRRIWVRVKVNVPDVLAANGSEQALRARAADASE